MGNEVREIVHEAGGDEADLGELFNESFRDFGKDIGPYILAGMGQFAVIVPVTMLMVMVVYIGGMVGMMGGWIAGMVAMVGLASLLGDFGAFLGAILMMFLPILGFFVVFLPVMPVMVAIMAPINASLTRAVAAHQRGEKEMTLASSFDTAFQDAPRVVMTGMMLGLLTMVGLLFCYVGALAVPVLFGFVNTLVILHNRGPIEAMRIQLAHLREHSHIHLMIGLVQMAMGMAAGFIPVIGPMFMLDVQVRAHRKMFGDGPEPVL